MLFKPLIFQLTILLAAVPPAAALTIGGQVTAGGTPLANTVVTGPKAVCTLSDAAGNYSCNVPSGWTGTLAAYANGYTFSPATHEFAGLAASQAGQNFAAVRASGLRSEAAVWRNTNARYYIDVNGDSATDLKPFFGAAGDTPLAGDLDGNGVTDLVVYRGGLWYVDYNLDGVVDRAFAFGGDLADVPLLCDVDGDGTDDLVIYRNGTWFVSTTRSGVADRIYQFGLNGDTPLCGDFNGDGLADFALYRNGVWYVDTNHDGVADIVASFGVPGDIPVVLDYDGDGRSDIAVFRNGVWYVSTQLDGVAQAAFSYGIAGDRPLAGRFDRANTLFVKAGSPCVVGCTMANPYGTITSAWQDAPAGVTIRVAAGTYPENIVVYYPGINYAPGKFGKNNIKLVGVSRTSVVVAPALGDALFMYGATGYVVRAMRLTGGGNLGRGIVTVGGPGSVSPAFPGPQLSLAQVDVTESDGTNILLSGTSNTRIRDTRINRSRRGHAMSVWHASYARVLDSALQQNGYLVAPGPPLPDAGKGFDVRESSELDARRSLIRSNLTMGVSGVGSSVVRLTSNTIDGQGYDGIIIGGATANDATVAYVTGNWVAGNGTVPSATGFNGLEIYITSIGSHQAAGNAFVGNSGNGMFIGSGTATISGNYFQGNRVGLIAYSGFDLGLPSSADTTMTVYGNTFDSHSVEGLYAERDPATTRKINATIGGTAAGQANLFHNIQPPAYFAIECKNLQATFVCPAGGNTFVNNVRDIDAAMCPSSCVK